MEITIKLTEEQLNQIKQQVPEKVEVDIKYGNKYYFIEADGEVCPATHTNHPVDIGRIAIGNAYHTEKEAESALAKLKAITTIKNYIKKNFGVFEPDWSDDDQEKCIILYNYRDKKFIINTHFWLSHFTPFGYLAKYDHAQQLIRDCDKELRIIFDVK